MAENQESLLGPGIAELRRLRDELRSLAVARWKLARLEILQALADVRRLAIALAVAGLLALVALPVLVVATADMLDGFLSIDRAGWLLMWFAALVVAAVATGWLAWRRFRRQFVGLEETLEELREDAAWLEQTWGSSADPKNRPA
ncbi:MAG: phage holin family protein [Planctomycetia bacterium]|nr:phage holin family protein [Planctomycetia bacterium]